MESPLLLHRGGSETTARGSALATSPPDCSVERLHGYHIDDPIRVTIETGHAPIRRHTPSLHFSPRQWNPTSICWKPSSPEKECSS